jgi:hypothetical protein
MEYYAHKEFGSPAGSDGALVLPGVPKIGYSVATCPFPGSLRACFLMGVRGAAFRRFWNRDDDGNVDSSYFALEPALRREIAAEVRLAREREERAVERIERALGKLA